MHVQPLWCWPILGAYPLQQIELAVEADGYTPSYVNLAQELGSLSLRESTAAITVLPQPR